VDRHKAKEDHAITMQQEGGKAKSLQWLPDFVASSCFLFPRRQNASCPTSRLLYQLYRQRGKNTALQYHDCPVSDGKKTHLLKMQLGLHAL